MKKLLILLATIAVAALGLVGPAAASGRPLTAELSGANEVAVAGDPDGVGTVAVALNQGQGTVCFTIATENVDGIVAAHIHQGVVGTNGGVVVNLDWASNGATGCVEADAELIKTIRQSPEGFYVNVHSIAHPGGAVRGQLTR